MLKLAHEDIEIIVISNTDVQNIKWVLEDIKATQVKLLEIKSTMFGLPALPSLKCLSACPLGFGATECCGSETPERGLGLIAMKTV